MTPVRRPEENVGYSAVQRWLRWTAKCLGITVGAGMALTSLPAASQSVDYRASQNAPATWREFAIKVQARLQERLATEDDSVRRLHRELEDRAAAASETQFIVLKAWVSSAGHVERLEFDGFDDDLSTMLRGILGWQEVGAAPPIDLLQPLHLKLSLRRPH